MAGTLRNARRLFPRHITTHVYSLSDGRIAHSFLCEVHEDSTFAEIREQMRCRHASLLQIRFPDVTSPWDVVSISTRHPETGYNVEHHPGDHYRQLGTDQEVYVVVVEAPILRQDINTGASLPEETEANPRSTVRVTPRAPPKDKPEHRSQDIAVSTSQDSGLDSQPPHSPILIDE